MVRRKIERQCRLAVERVHDFHFRVAVDALVEPGFFEFVGGDHAVPILVSEFMFGDKFWAEHATCGMFHAVSRVIRVGYSIPPAS